MCGLLGPSARWPPGNDWCRREEADARASCDTCIACHRHGVPSHFAIEQRYNEICDLQRDLYTRDQLISVVLAKLIDMVATLSHYGLGKASDGILALQAADAVLAVGLLRRIVGPGVDAAVLRRLAEMEASLRYQQSLRDSASQAPESEG